MIKDDLDWKILDLLQENARLSFAQIGRAIGLSPSAVAERIQRLEDTDVITGYKAQVNPKKVGQPLSAFIMTKINTTSFEYFVKHLNTYPEMVQCSRVTGQDCLIMKFHLTDSNHLEQIINRLSKYGDPTTLVVLSELLENGKITQQ